MWKFRSIRDKNDSEDEFTSYNISKFLNKEINILLITGFSGSGKSTLAEKYKYKYDLEHIELDLIDPSNPDSNELLQRDLMSDSNQVFFDFLDTNEDIYQMIRKHDTSPKTLDSIITRFIPYCIKWCIKHDYTDFAIEGTAIYKHPEVIDKKLPIIVMNTSAEESQRRILKREEIMQEDITSAKNIEELENFKKSLQGEQNENKEN